jgi:hypothetical protein
VARLGRGKRHRPFIYAGFVTVVGVTPIAGSDTGAGAEVTTLTAAIPATDIGSGGAQNQTVAITATDANGAITENAAVTVPIAGSDSNGATTEATTLLAAIPASDTASGGAQAQNLTVAVTAVDTGSGGTQAQTLVAAITVTDTNGATTEGIGNRALTQVDTNGATTESASSGEFNFVSNSDTGTSTETAAITAATISTADSSTGSDVGILLAVPPTQSDTGSIVDAEILVARITQTETGLITDIGTGGPQQQDKLDTDTSGPTIEFASVIELLEFVGPVKGRIVMVGRPSGRTERRIGGRLVRIK